MKNFKIIFATFVILCAVVLTGCGGGGGNTSSTPAPQPSSSKDITSYSINGVQGKIDETNKTITLTLGAGTDLTHLVATFTAIGDVKVGTTEEISGQTPNDFTQPIKYTVTAADGSSETFTINVSDATTADIKSFSINGSIGTINEADKTIGLTLPYDTDLTTLTAMFTATGRVSVGTTEQDSGVTSNDFTNPVKYTVSSADGSNQVTFTVIVSIAKSSAKDITNYSINGVTAKIDEDAETISLNLPSGTDLTHLVANFNSTGTSVLVKGITQSSGITQNNFTSALTYIVMAHDGSSKNYVVTVTAASSAKDITNYSINGVTGQINEAAKTISINLPSGTDLTHLVANFTSTGDSVKVDGTQEVSGVTINNFTTPVTYTVIAHDQTNQNFVVTVTNTPPLPPVTPCTNHSCTQIWSLDKSPSSVILNGYHPGAECDGAGVVKETLDSGKYMLTLTGNPNRHTCYAIIPGVFGSNPNHIYLEATVKLDYPQGANPHQIWPAFWTTGSNWPHNGEIDIAEGDVNEGFSDFSTYTNLHGTGGASQGPTAKYKFSGLTDFGNWHTYGMELMKNPITMHIEIATYLDGNQVSYFNNTNATGMDAQDYKDIINGFSTHNIVFDADNNNADVQYSMYAKNVNAYVVN